MTREEQFIDIIKRISVDQGTKKSENDDQFEEVLKTMLDELIAPAPKGYKEYKAIISQSGAGNHPDVVVLNNDTGLTFNWVYAIVGLYRVDEIPNSFPLDKTELIMGSSHIDAGLANLFRVDDRSIAITTYNDATSGKADGLLKQTTVIVRIHD